MGLLDEPLPMRFIPVHTLLSYLKMKKMLSSLSDADVLNLPLMTDQKKLALMRILNFILPYAFTGYPVHFLLMSMHVTQLSLLHGGSLQ